MKNHVCCVNKASKLLKKLLKLKNGSGVTLDVKILVGSCCNLCVWAKSVVNAGIVLIFKVFPQFLMSEQVRFCSSTL